MPYKDQKKQAAYQLRRALKRRRQWVEMNGPCAQCGSEEDLEVDHIDPSKKLGHRMWSWSEKRLKTELAKCQVLCRSCHQKKSAENLEGTYEFDADLVRRVRELREAGHSFRSIARETGVSKSHAHRIVSGDTRNDVAIV